MAADTDDPRRRNIYRQKLAAARDAYLKVKNDKRKSSTEKTVAEAAYEQAVERIDNQFHNGTGGW